MTTQPTATELAQIAATLDPNLPPQKAVARAQALFRAADEALRAEEIADEQEDKQMMGEAKRLAEVGLDYLSDEMIGMSEAFKIAAEIAERRKVPPYKTETGFIAAMRKAKLTITRHIHGKTIREWIESDEPEMPMAGTEELSSVRAVEELFKLLREQRKRRDRERKNPPQTADSKNGQSNISEKITRNGEPAKAEDSKQKRKAGAPKRKTTGKKRKTARPSK